MAFKQRISFATDLAANPCLKAFARRHLKSLCCLIRILADDLSSGLRSAALHRIRFGTSGLFLCHIFTQRPMNVRKIERSDGRGFGRQQLPASRSRPAATAADSETPCVRARRQTCASRAGERLKYIFKNFYFILYLIDLFTP